MYLVDDINDLAFYKIGDIKHWDLIIANKPQIFRVFSILSSGFNKKFEDLFRYSKDDYINHSINRCKHEYDKVVVEQRFFRTIETTQEYSFDFAETTMNSVYDTLINEKWDIWIIKDLNITNIRELLLDLNIIKEDEFNHPL